MAKEFGLSLVLKVTDKLSAPLKRIGKNIGNLTNPMDKVRRGAEKTERDTKKSFQNIGKTVNSIGKGMDKFGKWMTLRVTTPLAALGIASTKASMDINKGMANVSTLLTGSPESVAARTVELKKSVQSMSMDFGKRTGDMAGGLYRVISVFGDSSETLDRLGINAKAATAGLATTEEAIGLTAAITKAYGNTTAEAVQKASDLAFATVRLGDTNFPALAASIGRVAPLAAKLNISQEELFGTFATLTGVTGDTSEVSTQLSAVLTSMLKPSKEMGQAIDYMNKKFGTTYKSAADMMKKKGIVYTLKTLIDLVKGNDEVFTQILGGRKEGLLAAFALTGAQYEDFTWKTKDMYKAMGETDKAFEKQTKGINATGHSWKQFLAKFQVFRERTGDILAPSFQKIIDFSSKVLTKFENLDDGMQTFIIATGGVAGSIGPLSIVFGKFFKALKFLPIIFSGPQAPIVLGIIAAAGAIAAIALAIQKVRQELKPFDKKWSKLTKEEVSGAVGKASVEGSRLTGARMFREAGIEDIGAKPFQLGKRANINEASIKAMGGQIIPSETDINIKVQAESGSMATIEKVDKKKGNAKVNIATQGYIGQTLGAIP